MRGEAAFLFLSMNKSDSLFFRLLSSVCIKIRLQECLQERAELLQAHEATNRQREKDKMEYKRAREAWDRRRSEVESDVSRLQRELKHSFEQIKGMERKQEVRYQQRK